MNLKSIIKTSNWEALRDVFLKNYPDQEKLISGYEMVYQKLKTKSPAKTKMELFCVLEEPTFKDDEPYHNVHGRDGTRREDGELEKFSLSLSSWSKWLGATLSEITLNKYTTEEIISHCLFDMTFHGFSEEEIKKVSRDLNKSVKDSEDPIRYIIVSDILSDRKWQHYFDVSTETWCNEIDSATIFKREKYALAVLKALNKGKVKSNFIAKITTKNKKRRVLKYFR